MAHNCEACRFRKKHDEKPDSIIGRLWRWHINWCPGWKRYITSISAEQRDDVAKKYNLKKYLL